MAIYKKGSDPVALRASAERMTAHARSCEAVRSEASRALHSLEGQWRGGDLQQLMRSWPPLDAQLGRFGDDLGRLAEALRRNAGQQDAASGGGAGGSGAGPLGGTRGPGGPGAPGAPGAPAQRTGPGTHLPNPNDPATAAARSELEARLAGMTPAEREAYLKSDEFRAWMMANQANADGAKLALDALFDGGQLQPGRDNAYASFLMNYWGETAMREAGIDPASWDPEQGFTANRETITEVYEYYGQFFLSDPEKYQWAGMANMIGPSFAGGFADLAMMRDVAQDVAGAAGILPDGITPAELRMIEAVANLGDSELQFYESQLLSMQREIFVDQGGMHLAYSAGGLAEIDRMATAGYLEPQYQAAWHGIDSGDPSRVTEGNELLLYREQHDIILDDYDTMRNHPVTGQVVTYGMTLLGAPSIPGAHTYGELFNVHGSFETPGPERLTSGGIFGVGAFDVDNPTQGTVHWETPFPDGNISNFDDRWRLIESDTLPAYQELLATDPERAREIVASNFDQRLEDNRLTNNLGPTAGRLVDGFGVDFDQ